MGTIQPGGSNFSVDVPIPLPQYGDNSVAALSDINFCTFLKTNDFDTPEEERYTVTYIAGESTVNVSGGFVGSCCPSLGWDLQITSIAYRTEEPVPTESTTWGSIKTSFKDEPKEE